MWVPKLLLTPIKIRIFSPQTAKICPKYAFLVIFNQILAFFAQFVPCPNKNQCEQGARWVFRYAGNNTLAFSSKNQDFLPKNDQIWPEIGIFAHLVPCWGVGRWLSRAGCISQDTYLLYFTYDLLERQFENLFCFLVSGTKNTQISQNDPEIPNLEFESHSLLENQVFLPTEQAGKNKC